MLVGQVQVAARTTTGTTDITVSGYGTCKGAIFWITKATTNATAVDDAIIGYGATDGTRDRAAGTSSQHGLTDTNTFKRAKTGKCVMLIDASTGAIDGEAQFSAFITDGIRINTTDAFAAAYKINCLLFFGSDCSFYVGDFDTGSGNATVTAPGFRPNIVNVFGIRAAINDTATANAGFSNGWCSDDGTTTLQGSMNWGEVDNVTTGAPYMRLETSLVARDLQDSLVGPSQSLGSFGSSGFTVTQGGGSGFPSIFVAIKCDNHINWAQYNTPTTTGSQAYTTPAFRPMAVFGFLTRIRSAGANNQVAVAGSFGAFGFTSSSNEFSASISTEDAAATTNTQSIVDSIFEDLPAHDGSSGTGVGIIADVSSIDSVGFTINFTNVDTTNNRVFGGLSVQEMVFAAVTVSADAATVSLSMQKRAQTAMTISAGAATTAISAQKRTKATMAVSAGAATTSAPTQLVHQHRQSFCADFLGTNDFLVSTSGSDWGFTAFVEVWIRPDAVASDSGIYCLWDAADNPADSSLRIRLKGSNIFLDLVDGQDLNVYTFDTSFTATNGVWTQIIVEATTDVLGNAFVRAIFSQNGVFGVRIFEAFLPSGFFPNTPGTPQFFLGKDPVTAQFYDGRMMKVRNYAATQSLAQYATLYNFGAGLETDRGAALVLPSPFGANVSAAAELDEFSTGVTAADRQVQHSLGGGISLLTDSGIVPSAIRGWWLGAHNATVTLDMDVVRTTSIAVSAGAATVIISGKLVRQTATTCSAAAATAAISVQKRAQTTVAVSAGTATVVISAKRVVHATVAISSSAATVSISASHVRQSTVAVSAGAATVTLDMDVVRQTTVTVSASAATTAIVAQRIAQTTVACSAGAATTAISAQKRMYTSLAVSAGAAVGAIAAQRIVQTTTATSAGNATTNISVAVGAAIDATLAVSAAAAVVVISAHLIRQTSVAVSAAPATALVDADHVAQTTTSVSAGVAIAIVAGIKRSQANVSVTAAAATTLISAQRIVQTTVSVTAGAATCAINAEVEGVVAADVAVSAGAATTAITAKAVRQTSVSVSAASATTAVVAKRVVQTAMAVSAGAATCNVSGDVAQVLGDVSVTAGAATTLISAKRATQTSSAVQAGSASASVAVVLVRQASVSVTAGTAQAVLDVDRIVQTTTAASAGSATCAISGTTIQVSGSVTAQAGNATTSISGQVIHRATASVSAGNATTAITGQRVHQTAMACSAGAATCVIAAGLNITTTVALAAGSAMALVAGQRIVQTSVAVQARPARAIALEVIVPALTDEYATIFEPLSSFTIVTPSVFADIEAPVAEVTLVAPATEADIFVEFNFKLIVGTMYVQASPAMVSIQGVVL